MRSGHVSQIDWFVTDRPLPENIADMCLRNGVSVEVVPDFDSAQEESSATG